MRTEKHKYLVIPGPVEVRPEVLDAQAQWMIGHRSTAFADLYARLQGKLRQAFLTENRVLQIGSSGTGFWEGASRNCIRDGKKALHLVGGAFSERWADISQANGKEVDVLPVEWGQAHTPEMVADALKKETYDAVCVVHNETSTGVTNPIKDIGAVVRQYEDTLLLVDTVSGFLGAEFRTDEWGVDFALTSSQKAFALPPGIAFAACSDRVLERAKEVKNRGYYFDLLEIDKSAQKNNTPSTPPIALMYAADLQTGRDPRRRDRKSLGAPPANARDDPQLGARPGTRLVRAGGLSLADRDHHRQHQGLRHQRDGVLHERQGLRDGQGLRQNQGQDLPHRAHGRHAALDARRNPVRLG